MLTLHHQPWLMQAPNTTLDRITGTGAYTASRDLALDLYGALSARGIHMMLYLNLRIDPEGACLPPIKRALGPCPPEDETIDQVVEVYREFAERYGPKVVGWWVDGVWRPEFKQQPEERREHWFATLADALRAGNPDAAIAFNPGVKDALMRYTPQNDYLAGEANDMREPPATRFLDGAQWHVWPHLGQWWGSGGTQFPTKPLCDWASRVVAAGGVLSFDVGTRGITKLGQGFEHAVQNFTPGAIDPVQVAQIRCVSEALHERR